MYRFRNRARVTANADLVDRALDARLNQVFVPLLSVIDDPAVRELVMKRAREHHEDRRIERAESVDARVLTILRHLFENKKGIGVAVGDVAKLFRTHFESEVARPVTNRWIGLIIRTKLGLRTQKSNGNFVVPATELAKLDRLYERYGVTEEDVKALGEKSVDEFVWIPDD